MEIAAEVSHDDPRGRMVPRRGRGPLAVLAGVHGVVGQHRDAAHPAVPRPAGGGAMILDLSDDAKEYGRQALRAFEAAGGDQLRAAGRGQARHPGGARRPGARRTRRLGTRPPHRRRRPGGRRRAVPQRGLLGAARTRSPSGLPRPTDLDVDGLIVVDAAAARRPRSAASKHVGPQSRWTATRSTRHRPGRRRPGVRRPRSSCRRSTTTARATSRSGWCCRAGRCSACSTVQSN